MNMVFINCINADSADADINAVPSENAMNMICLCNLTRHDSASAVNPSPHSSASTQFLYLWYLEFTDRLLLLILFPVPSPRFFRPLSYFNLMSLWISDCFYGDRRTLHFFVIYFFFFAFFILSASLSNATQTHTHKEKAFAIKQNSSEANEIPEIRLLTLKK